MKLYYILILSTLFCGWYFCVYKPSRKITLLYLNFFGVILISVSTLRYAIGFDYFSYQTIYQHISDSSFSSILAEYQHKELGFALLNKAVSLLGGDYVTFLFLVNLLITGIIMQFIYRYSSIPEISVFLYIALPFFSQSMNLIRQFLSACIFLLAYPFLLKRKFIPYAGIVLLAAEVHRSALILLPLYFFLSLPIKWKNFLFIGTAALATYLFMDPVFDIVFPGYRNTLYWTGNSPIYLILPSLYFFFTLYFGKRLLEKNSNHSFLINTAFYTFLINFFITKHFILERFSIYVFLFSLILLPEIITLGNRYKKLRILLVFSYGMSYFLFAVQQGFHNVYPYVSIFQKAK